MLVLNLHLKGHHRVLKLRATKIRLRPNSCMFKMSRRGSAVRELYSLTRKIQVGFPGSTLPSLLSGVSSSSLEPGTLPTRHAVLALCVCSGGEDALAVVTAGGEVLTLDMAVVQVCAGREGGKGSPP